MYLGYLFIFIAALCWGFLGVFGRIAMSAGVEPLDVAFCRAFFGSLFMFLHAMYLKDARVRSMKDLSAFFIFGLFSIAVFFASYQYAVLDAGVALASVLLYTAPAWVALFLRIFYSTSLSKMSALAIVLALCGVFLISYSSGSPAVEEGSSLAENAKNTLPLLGISCGLLAGFLYATHFIFTKKYLTIYSSFTIYAYGSIFAAFALLPFTSLTSFNFNLSIEVWLSLFATAFVSTYLAYWAYCEGIKRLNPTKAAVIANLEPVIAGVAAFAIWGESFTFMAYIGILLILSTVFLLLYDDKKRATIENNLD